jgi:hypothetical protein
MFDFAISNREWLEAEKECLEGMAVKDQSTLDRIEELKKRIDREENPKRD